MVPGTFGERSAKLAGALAHAPVVAAQNGSSSPLSLARFKTYHYRPVRQAADRISGEIAAALNGQAKGQVAPIRG